MNSYTETDPKLMSETKMSHEALSANDSLMMHGHSDSESTVLGDEISISQRLSDLRALMEKRQGRRITDEELASRFRVSKSSIGNWKRDMVKTLLPETERRFQELYDEALGERASSDENDYAGVGYGRVDTGDQLISGTVSIVKSYLERSRTQMSAEELRHLISQVKRGLAE
ncbi:MAG: hypothetical protein P1V97_35285 [Planctomycetota bacterium]|nr:hypothetical protein [Planctomycetota bacterium]